MGNRVKGDVLVKRPLLSTVGLVFQVVALFVPGIFSLVGSVLSDTGDLFFILWAGMKGDELKIYIISRSVSIVVAIVLLALQKLQFVSIPSMNK